MSNIEDDQDTLAVKSKDISTALGISTEPAKLNDSHVGAVDGLHDAIGETKAEMQGKGNYVASTHLSTAQRHLKDAKSVLETKALNADTKHVLAKAAVGRASASLTKATSAAAAPDKSKVFSHNSDLKAFASNPDGTFQKMNENHDDHGRFASGDGGGSSSGSSTGGDTKALNSIASTENAVHSAYGNAVAANYVAGQPASGDMLDMTQAREDGLNHLADAKGAIQSGNYSQAASSLRSAADGFGQSPTFASHAADARVLAASMESAGNAARANGSVWNA